MALVYETIDPVLVCGLHVTPVIMWGIAEPEEPEIRVLPSTTARRRRAA